MNQQPLTEKILAYWKETDAFKRSIDTRPQSMRYMFFDGPPFTSGDPHYGHLLQSVVKDMVPRWMTMRGYRVDRKWGRDCHGIPAENYVNKQIGISSRKQVEEEYGIQNYIEACRSMVNQVNTDWQWTVDNLGRWVDMKNAYFTMNNDYMESVIHVFSDLYNKNLIYKGFKVLGYSWALGTALSNSEIAEGYEMRQDPAVTVKLTLKRKQEAETPSYELCDDGYGEVTLGVIRNKEDSEKMLMVYDLRSGKRFIPGGKVDSGETLESSITREIEEEIGLQVTQAKPVGRVKVPHHGNLRGLNYIELEVVGTPINKEPEKQGAIAWISKIESDNDLGYSIKVEPVDNDDGTIIDDVEQIEYDFADFLMAQEHKYSQEGMSTAKVSMLAWTTTPWTLPSNMFGAVNTKIVYALIFDKEEKEYFIIAKTLLNKYYKDDTGYVYLFAIKGEHLVGLRYDPLFSFYHDNPHIEQRYKNEVHQILEAEFVTQESGTGIAHEAPAFGEDDYNLVCSIFPREHAQDWLFDPVNVYGEFTDLVPNWEGINVIEANKEIVKALKESGKLVKHETINHSYPHCPRTGTPLIYKAIESRFVKEDQLKSQTLPETEQQHFVPSAIKKRFYNGLESAPDWNISRTRFWGCPLPVRENEKDPDERIVMGSIEDIYQHNKPLQQVTKVILMRHGRTDYNESGWLDSDGVSRLSDEGRLQAKNMAEQIVQEGVDVLYSSPLQRCLDTVQELADLAHLEVIADERIKEIQVPIAQGKSFDCSKVVWEGNKKILGDTNGEGIQDVFERVKEFMLEIIEKNKGKTIVICSHGDPLVLMRKVLGEYDYDTQKGDWYISNNPKKGLPFVIEYIFTNSVKRFDLHRPYIDDIGLINPKTNNQLTRIPEVLDCWFESGSMPYGQNHRMKNTVEDGSQLPTADFIAEGLDQTRGWFRSLHVLSNAYLGRRVFDNVVVTGMILAEDGKKMSKSLKNYPDPSILLKKYGADALRLYLLSSPVVRAEPLRFNEQGVQQMLKDFVIPVNNVWNFLKTYAEVDGWKDPGTRMFFMRHAHCPNTAENIRTKDSDLTQEGYDSLETKKFKESVLRANPDIIISSDHKRAITTANAARHIMKEEAKRDVELIETDDVSLGMNKENAGEIFSAMSEKYKGKRVLIISHKKRLTYLWKHLMGVDDVENNEIVEKLFMENLEVVPLPLGVVHNELDKWILAELHSMIENLDASLGEYNLEPATKALLAFVDKLTNWYVRRSRRRFWSSGLTEDKVSAYETLQTVLETYLQCAAPFTPFVTESIRQEMGKDDSVHLGYRPFASDKFKDKQLMEEIEIVRKVIKGALTIRAKKQIKVKQPLSQLSFKL